MNKLAVKKILKKIPTSPGVYFFLDKNKKPLYVGKAVNLKNRVNSYFHGAQMNPKILKMLEIAKNLDFRKTESEIEALILESQLIKKLKPKFNIKMRDDKQYFYVVFTKEKFPKIFLTHQIQKQVFQYRHINMSSLVGPFTDGTALKTTLKLLRRILPYCTCKQKHNNFCLNYHIEKCIGFCCLKKEAPKEKSIEYKKNIKAIKNILTGKRTALIKKNKKEMIMEGNKGNLEKAIKLQKQVEKLERVFENAKIIQKFAKDSDVLDKMKKIFNLSKLPTRIEGYDVSNIQGANATGSMVVFENGLPNKNEYRKFRIRTKKTPDDTAMLREVLIRRFNHPEWRYPDLILIDGGKGQLNTAIKIMLERKMNIPIISMAKGREEIFSYNKQKAMPMTQLPDNVKNLIKHIDSEAHRFAISYYRKLHRKIIV